MSSIPQMTRSRGLCSTLPSVETCRIAGNHDWTKEYSAAWGDDTTKGRYILVALDAPALCICSPCSQSTSTPIASTAADWRGRRSRPITSYTRFGGWYERCSASHGNSSALVRRKQNDMLGIADTQTCRIVQDEDKGNRAATHRLDRRRLSASAFPRTIPLLKLTTDTFPTNSQGQGSHQSGRRTPKCSVHRFADCNQTGAVFTLTAMRISWRISVGAFLAIVSVVVSYHRARMMCRRKYIVHYHRSKPSRTLMHGRPSHARQT